MLDVQLLGEFRLTDDGAALPHSIGPRSQACIGWLALHPHSRPTRLQLASVFWPDATEEQARGNLRKALHDLRRAVPAVDRLVHVEGDRVWWAPEGGGRVDVHRFETAAREARTLQEIEGAIEHYAGELLPECYDEWVLEERDRLQALVGQLLQTGMTLAVQEGEYRRAVAYGERLLRDEPLEEETYRRLMRAYALDGDLSGALRIYHRCVSLLERELGVAPSLATSAVYESLLPGSSQETTVFSPARLAGREEEWKTLQAAWRRALTGRLQVALVTGDPGIGKTRLLEELRSWADHHGIPAAYARCYEVGANLAYAPLATLLRSISLENLDRTRLTELSRILPDIAIHHPNLATPGPIAESWQRTRLFEALGRAVLAVQPSLVMVDDLQWIDAESLEWLGYLVRSQPSARLLLVCALRPEGMFGTPARAVWQTVRAEGRLVEIELAALGLPAAREIVSAMSSRTSDEETLRLWEETEGNPFFLIEVLRAGVGATGAMPESVQALLFSRLGSLSGPALELAQLAATMGRDFTLPVLAAAWPNGEDSLVQSLDELWGARIVRERGSDAYDFTHDKLRQAAYDMLSAAGRRTTHRKIGEALELTTAETEPGSGEIAYHLEAAGQTQRAARRHVRAADAARLVFANGPAIDHYRRAMQLSPEVRSPLTLLHLGDVYRTVGDLDAARTTYRDGVELAIAGGDGIAESWLRYGLANLLKTAGDLDGALEEFSRAADVFAAAEDVSGQSSALSQIGITLTMKGEVAGAETAVERALSLASRTDDHVAQLLALRSAAYLRMRQWRLEECERYARAELELAEARNEPRHRGTALADLGTVSAMRGEYGPALEHLVQSLECLSSIGYTAGVSTAASLLGDAYERAGARAEARRCFGVAGCLALKIGDRQAVYLNGARLGHLAARAGCLDEADRLLVPVAAWLDAGNRPFWRADALEYLADFRARQRGPAAARSGEATPVAPAISVPSTPPLPEAILTYAGETDDLVAEIARAMSDQQSAVSQEGFAVSHGPDAEG